MSTGRIQLGDKERFDNKVEQGVAETFYKLIPKLEIDVDDTKWEEADESIREEINKIDKERESADEEIKESITALKQKQKEEIKNLETKLDDINKRLGDNQGNLSDEIKNIGKEIEKLKARKTIEVIVKREEAKPLDLGKQHYQFPMLLKILASKLNVYIVGPAGAGKTYAADQCAKALGVKFYFTGAVASEFKLTGFMDAQGKPVFTEFRKAFEKGGLFLFDEIDASYPQAVLAFNAALANDYMDFPDERVKRHEKFYCIAAANTYGQGADRQYVGRNQLDAASLDRFVFLDWKYDENLERDLAGNQDWSDYVQKVRRCIEELKIRHVVSPRASIYGAKLLAKDISREIVEQTILWKGLDEATKNKILENIAPKEVQASREGTFIPKVKKGDKVAKEDIIGEIEYRRYSYKDDTSTEEITAPFNGIIISISENKEVKDKEIIAEIDCYGN